MGRRQVPAAGCVPSPSYPPTADLTRLGHNCSVSFNKYRSAQRQRVGHYIALSLRSSCNHNNYSTEIWGQLRTRFSSTSGTDGAWLPMPSPQPQGTPRCGAGFPSAGLGGGSNIYFHSASRNPTSFQTQPLWQICFKSAVGSAVTGEGSTDTRGRKLPVSLG